MKNRSAVGILVVEDRAFQAEVLRRKLLREGYQVAVAENNAQALDKVRKIKPALVHQRYRHAHHGWFPDVS
jgi:CheY-like chemotaxis protein